MKVDFLRPKERNMRHPSHRAKGFSLIETLVAIAFLGMMVISLLSVLTYGFGSVARTRQVALAAQICQERVEAVRNMPFDAILALGPTFSSDKLARLSAGQGLQVVETSSGPDIKKLTVSVSWSYRGQTRRKDIVTFITRMGVDRK